MPKQLKIYIACGSGIATSTVVAEKIKEILQAENIQAVITKGNLNQIEALDGHVDIIMCTAMYRKPTQTPILPVFGLISGINEDAIKQKIISKCKELQEN